MSDLESGLGKLEVLLLDFASDELESPRLITKGQYYEAITHDKSPLNYILNEWKSKALDGDLSGHEKVAILRDEIEDYLTLGSSSPDRQLGLLFGGIASFLIFVQLNWTGPLIKQVPADGYLDKSLLSHSEVLDELSIDGEVVYKKCVHPEFLLVAKSILIDNSIFIKGSKSVNWWSARCAFILQRMLSGPCETLRNFISAQFSKAIFVFSSTKGPEILLEYGLSFHHYKDSQRAREYFLKAKSASKLYCELSGAMGRRTKYQTFDTAQLILLAQSFKEGRDQPEESSIQSMTPSHFVEKDSIEEYLGPIPSTNEDVSGKLSNEIVEKSSSRGIIEHEQVDEMSSKSCKKHDMLSQMKPDEDDIRLSAPKLVDTDSNQKAFTDENLKITDQAILLALCLDVKNENPKHGLTWEQMKAYVERVMKHPNNWMVHSMALLVKSRLEANESKYMDRAVMQIQVLIDQYKDEDQAKDYPVQIRTQRIFQIYFPPLHRLKSEIGDLYLQLGVARSALQVFEELEMWSEAVSALQLCGEDSKARQLVAQRIEQEGENPEYLCLMGDTSEEKEEKINFYNKCWNLSRGKYPKAKRQLGKLAMDEKDYKSAIGHYKEALSINPQYGFAWFRLGCCAIEISDWSTAQHAFTRVTFLHPDDGEAWSNLAASCLKQNMIKEAHSAFKEALKHQPDNWRIWDNYMVTCVKLGAIQEAIYCLHKLLELNASVDIEVLDILVKIATSKFQLENGTAESLYVHKQLRMLLGRITSKISNNPELWNVYAKYHEAMKEWDKVIDYRQKQTRSLQTHGWETDSDKFNKIVDSMSLLTSAIEIAKDKATAYSTKLQIRSILKKSRDNFGDSNGYQSLEKLAANLDVLSQ